ncbi:TPA: hypothetical protein QDZ84_002879 [Shewanella algae]|uniref:hypothetical protein n=1 Tax=Shewanella algae TaxID=38313 RepID=UPI001AB01DB6|nr:hypothetical protein [Shewanella algae]MBO2580266.1 hypothetical protein [Shewanella algae]HDS1207852.1 hypothetical protein [Shewanella algae]
MYELKDKQIAGYSDEAFFYSKCLEEITWIKGWHNYLVAQEFVEKRAFAEGISAEELALKMVQGLFDQLHVQQIDNKLCRAYVDVTGIRFPLFVYASCGRDDENEPLVWYQHDEKDPNKKRPFPDGWVAKRWFPVTIQ